jgi:hypothetical protein
MDFFSVPRNISRLRLPRFSSFDKRINRNFEMLDAFLASAIALSPPGAKIIITFA